MDKQVFDTNSDILSQGTQSLRTTAWNLVNNDFRPLSNISNRPNIKCQTPDTGFISTAFLKNANVKGKPESVEDARKKIRKEWEALKNLSTLEDDSIEKAVAKIREKEKKKSILAGFVVYIEMPNKSSIKGLQALLRSMGATVNDAFSQEVTHIIFKNGSLETYKRAKLLNVHLVSSLWVEACRNSSSKICERLFPVSDTNFYSNSPREFRKLMENQSKNFEYDESTNTIVRKTVPKNQSIVLNMQDLNINTNSPQKNISSDTSDNNSTGISSDSHIAISSKGSSQSIQLRISTDATQTSCDKKSINSDGEKSPEKLPTVENDCLNDENDYMSDENDSSEIEHESSPTNSMKNNNSTLPTKRRLFMKRPLEGSLIRMSSEEKSEASQPVKIVLPNPYASPSKRKVKKSPKKTITKGTKICDKSNKSISHIPPPIYAYETMKLFPRSQLTFKKSPIKNSIMNRHSSLVSTYLHSEENVQLKKIVSELGRFHFKLKVDNHTTHVVAGEALRTVNLLKGMARGCWILNKKWISESHQAGFWLAEEQYELREFSRVVQRNRIQRQAFGKKFGYDVFDDCGSIYVSKNSSPKQSDLQELIILCGGKIALNPTSAQLIIGEHFESKECLLESWILDSITLGRCKTTSKYIFNSHI